MRLLSSSFFLSTIAPISHNTTNITKHINETTVLKVESPTNSTDTKMNARHYYSFYLKFSCDDVTCIL